MSWTNDFCWGYFFRRRIFRSMLKKIITHISNYFHTWHSPPMSENVSAWQMKKIVWYIRCQLWLRVWRFWLLRFGIIPSRSLKRLSALYRFNCRSLKELLISLLSGGTLSISDILNLVSQPCIFILFKPTFSTIKIRPVYLCPSFSKTPRLFNNRTKSPLAMGKLGSFLLCLIFFWISSASSKISSLSG